MPGKYDFGAGGQLGQYYPGSHEGRAWDQGWQYRYSDVPLSAPITDNPYDDAELPNENAAWAAGWAEANANTGGAQRMPATTGAPPVP
jgi:hypothetical protein